MDNLLTMTYRGIKCDNPKCGFMDYNVTPDQYSDYVNKPCPLCGENLMTEECYENTKRILERVEKFNHFLNLITPRFLRKKLMKNKAVAVFDCDVNGNPIPSKNGNTHIDVEV